MRLTRHGLDTYRQKRRVGSRASNALYTARCEERLVEAEAAGRIRFEWDTDYDYRPESGEDRYDREEAAKLVSGEWEALCCIAYVPTRCQHCGQLDPIPGSVDHWTLAASLYGTVIDANDEYDYRREVERELADEAGVLAAPANQPKGT